MKTINYLVLTIMILSVFVIELFFEFSLTHIKGLSLKNITLYLLIISLVVQKILDKEENNNNYRISFFVFLFIIYLLFIFIYKKMLNSESITSSSLYSFKSSIDCFIIFIIVCNLNFKKKHLKKIILFLAIILFFHNFFTIISVFDNLKFVRIHYDENYGRVSGALHEPNVSAAYISMFIPLLISYVMFEKKISIKIFMTLNLFMAVYVLILTGSRGGFLSCLVGVLAYFFIIQKYVNVESIVKKSFAIIFLISIVLVAVYNAPKKSQSGLRKNVVSRYDTQSLDAYSSGRINLWKAAMTHYVKYPIFGSPQMFREKFGSNTHNTYIEILFNYGIVGFTLFMYILFTGFMRIKKRINCCKDCSLYVSFLSGSLSFLVSMIFLNMFSSYLFYFLYFALILNFSDIDLNKEEFEIL